MGPASLEEMEDNLRRFQVSPPKLKHPAIIHWPNYKSLLTAYARFYGIEDINGELSSTQDAMLFYTLSQGIDDATFVNVLHKDNPKCIGKKALENCDQVFATDSSTHKTALLRHLNTHLAPETNDQNVFSKYAVEHEALAQQCLASGVTLQDIFISNFYRNLPSTPEWKLFVISSMKDDKIKTLSDALHSAVQYTYSRSEANRNHASEHKDQVTALYGTGDGNNKQRAKKSQACNRCGGSHPSRECRRTREHTCGHCGKKGHFDDFCFRKKEQKPPGTGPAHGVTAFTALF